MTMFAGGARKAVFAVVAMTVALASVLTFGTEAAVAGTGDILVDAHIRSLGTDLKELSDAIKSKDRSGTVDACQQLAEDAKSVLSDDRPRGYPRAGWAKIVGAMRLYVKAAGICKQAVSKNSGKLGSQMASALSDATDKLQQAPQGD